MVARQRIFYSALSSWLVGSFALHVPLRQQRSAIKRSDVLQKRQLSASNSTGIQEAISNFQSTAYFVNVTVGGVEAKVLIDTGSTDLFIAPPSPDQIPQFNSTGIQASLAFGVGELNGTVGFAPFSFGNFSIPSQAFVNVTAMADFPLATFGAQGTIGLGFTSDGLASAIDLAFNDSGRDIVEANAIANLIVQNQSLDNYFTIQLGRTNDSSAHADGVFTVGELIEGLDAVDSAPKLPQTVTNIVRRWSATVEDVFVNGTRFPLQSSFNESLAGQAFALLDTGFARPPIPDALAQAIYGQIPGAILVPSGNGTWLVPCTATPPNVTFVFGGNSYPVHPLDLTALFAVTTEEQEAINGTVCVGNFVSGNSSATLLHQLGVDMILGQPFLRNVYAKYNLGNETVNVTSKEDSSVQLLSVTNLTTAFDDFVTSRDAALAASLPEIPPSVVISLLPPSF